MSKTRPQDPSDRRPRKPRHVRAAARMLQKEARRIVKRHGGRLEDGIRDEIAATVAAIDDGLARKDLATVEAEAERLDGLLDQHAAFARKSALRETLENVSVAVIVALGLRACVYEPFQIPSGSMMPTLLPGDHIFVNKFVYGIQIPFTNTVVGASMRQVGRGDVVVFRYPLDESDDYIKRVIGLPGDEIEVRGRQVFVKPAGSEEFVPIEQEPLAERCRDETGTKIVPNCKLYRERYGNHVYTVRYVRPEFAPLGEFQHFEVPEGHLFVMGDNRNQSEDSRAWMVKIEAVAADRVLTVADLRDLTDETLFTMRRPTAPAASLDPNVDRVVYEADHRSSKQDVEIEIYRRPLVPPEAVATLVPDGVRHASVEAFLEAAEVPPPSRGRLAAVLEPFDGVVVGRDDEAHVVAAIHRPTATAILLRCGIEACPNASDLATRVAEVLEAYLKRPEAPASDLLWDDGTVRYRSQVSSVRRASTYGFVAAWPEGRGGRTLVLRNPPFGIDRALDLVFAAEGTERGKVVHDEALPVPGGLSWALPPAKNRPWTWIGADLARRVVVAVRCPPARCRSKDDLHEIVRPMVDRMADAGSDPRAFDAWRTHLAAPDADRASAGQGGAAFERLVARGSRRGQAFRLEVDVRRRPPEGLDAAMARELADVADSEAADAVAPGARRYRSANGAWVLLVPVPTTQTLVRLACSPGLCPRKDVLSALGRRAFERASHLDNFVDREALRPKPYVPRGNVKGRADRIWWPPGRFWRPID